jgi:hypothetical protein
MAVPSRPQIPCPLGQARVPFDSFSLREKVAEGRMRVKPRGWFFAIAYRAFPD